MSISEQSLSEAQSSPCDDKGAREHYAFAGRNTLISDCNAIINRAHVNPLSQTDLDGLLKDLSTGNAGWPGNFVTRCVESAAL